MWYIHTMEHYSAAFPAFPPTPLPTLVNLPYQICIYLTTIWKIALAHVFPSYPDRQLLPQHFNLDSSEAFWILKSLKLHSCFLPPNIHWSWFQVTQPGSCESTLYTSFPRPMNYTEWKKKKISKGYILYDFIDVAFSKWQNCWNGKQISDSQGLGTGRGRSDGIIIKG